MKKLLSLVLSVFILISCKNQENVFIKDSNLFIKNNVKQNFNKYKLVKTLPLKEDITNCSLLLKMDSTLLNDFSSYDTSLKFKKFISKKIILKSNEMRSIAPSILDEKIISLYDTINPKFLFKSLLDSTLNVNKNISSNNKITPIMNIFKYKKSGSSVVDTLYLFYSENDIRLFGSGITYKKGYNYLGSAGQFKGK